MGGVGTSKSSLDVICCSMEPWDQVWRRNQFLVSEAMALCPEMRVLFVEPVADITWSLLHRKSLSRTGTRPVGDTGRLWAVTMRKWMPRRIRPDIDKVLSRKVEKAARRMGFVSPVLWINDNAYAPLVTQSGWPAVYDVTDDWLLADMSPRRLERERQNDADMMSCAVEVVVCSPGLASSRGADRPVVLIPNGVDVDHFRLEQDRPEDLPNGPVVLYSGTLSGGRLDIDLCVDLALGLRGRATLVFVGPNSCDSSQTQRLVDAGALLLGSRPYARMPAYLQHADVLVVPHVTNAFTESLDPIKAREIVAVGRPAVSTAVAGFRDLGPPVVVVPADNFVSAVLEVLDTGSMPPGPGPLVEPPGSWRERAEAFLKVLRRAQSA